MSYLVTGFAILGCAMLAAWLVDRKERRVESYTYLHIGGPFDGGVYSQFEPAREGDFKRVAWQGHRDAVYQFRHGAWRFVGMRPSLTTPAMVRQEECGGR